jgi:hypothetical protein
MRNRLIVFLLPGLTAAVHMGPRRWAIFKFWAGLGAASCTGERAGGTYEQYAERVQRMSKLTAAAIVAETDGNVSVQ